MTRKIKIVINDYKISGSKKIVYYSYKYNNKIVDKQYTFDKNDSDSYILEVVKKEACKQAIRPNSLIGKSMEVEF